MNWEEIRHEFETTDIKLKDLANKHCIKPTTLRSRKNREKWKRNALKNVATKEQHTATQHKNVATKNDGDLTSQQELFAQLVGGHRIPLYRAYQEAYSATKPSLATAMTNGPRLAKNKEVKLRIAQISQETARKYHWSTESVIDSYTFLHDESKTDIITNGVRKATADAMLQSLEDITDVLGLKQSSKAQARKTNAEAEIAEAKAKEIKKVEHHEDGTLVVDDLGGVDDDNQE